MARGKGGSQQKKREKFKGRFGMGRKELSQLKRKAGFKKGASIGTKEVYKKVFPK